MLYKFNTIYINLAEIQTMELGDTGDSTYPYKLTVRMKDGTGTSVKYSTRYARDDEAAQIKRSHDLTLPDPVTRYEVENIVSNEVEKMRRDFRRLRESLKEAKE